MFGCSATKHLSMPLPSWSCVESRLNWALELLWLDWTSTEPGDPALVTELRSGPITEAPVCLSIPIFSVQLYTIKNCDFVMTQVCNIKLEWERFNTQPNV